MLLNDRMKRGPEAHVYVCANACVQGWCARYAWHENVVVVFVAFVGFGCFCRCHLLWLVVGVLFFSVVYCLVLHEVC